MRGINLQDERGAALLASVFFIMLLGMIGLSLVTLTVADSQSEVISSGERQAFYAAYSGLEYGIKRVLTDASYYDWSETVETGGDLYSDVSVEFLGENLVRVRSNGHSSKFVKRLERTIDYIDVSQYAVYASGDVDYTFTNVWPNLLSNNTSLVYQHAPVMPIFDLDELRNLALPSRYYSGNLNILFSFTPQPNMMTFVEGHMHILANILTANEDYGYFTVMGDVHQNISGVTAVIYQPVAGKTYRQTLLGVYLAGGLITNGDVIGGSKWTLLYLNNLHVFYNQAKLRDFLHYSINGGPLVIRRNRWTNLN